MEIVDPNRHLQDRDNQVWIRDTSKSKLVVGTQCRILHQDASGRRDIAFRFNEMMWNGGIGPVMLGCDHHNTGGTDLLYRETSNIHDDPQFTADTATHCSVSNAAHGMSPIALRNGGGVGIGKTISGDFGLVPNGSELTDQITRESIPWDTMVGMSRRDWARNGRSIGTVATYNGKFKNSDHITMSYIVNDSLIGQAFRRATEKHWVFTTAQFPCTAVFIWQHTDLLRGTKQVKRAHIHRAAELVTCSGDEVKHGSEVKEVGTIKSGAVLIEDGHITLVGDTEELDKKMDFQTAELIDAGGQVVLPGFVDSRTHSLFDGYRVDEFGWHPRGESYLSVTEKGSGTNTTVTPTRAAPAGDSVAVGKERLGTVLRFGVTTVEGKSGYGMDKDIKLRILRAMKVLDESHPVDMMHIFLGPHSVFPEWRGKEHEFLRYMLTEVMPEVKKEDPTESVGILTETGVFNIEDSTWYLQEAKKLGFRLKIHADEIVSDFGSAGMTVGRSAHPADHLLKASNEGIRRLTKSNTVATLLPLTALCLKEPHAPARKLIDTGCAVTLASDLNPGSYFSNSISFLIVLDCIYVSMRIEEVVTVLTLNGAAVANGEKEIGSIDPGKQADLIFPHYLSIQLLPYRTGVSTVSHVMKRGEFVI